MIHDTFDPASAPLITPQLFFGEREKQGDVCLASFSCHVRDRVLETFRPEVVAQSGTANGKIDVLRFTVQGKPILFYLSPIGSAVAGTVMQEVQWLTKAADFVFFGSCGVLRPDLCRGKIIVPTEAYRDEGMSYHYAEKSDWIPLSHAGKVGAFLRGRALPYIAGRVWTTDAIYRETADKAAARRADGCLCVEMEAAGLEAVARYLGVRYHAFLFGGDVMAENRDWERGDLGGDAEKERQCSLLDVALEYALSL